MKIPIVILKLFFIGALFIISNQNLHLGVTQEREVFFHAYLGWASNIIHQAWSITGYIIKFSWLPS